MKQFIDTLSDDQLYKYLNSSCENIIDESNKEFIIELVRSFNDEQLSQYLSINKKKLKKEIKNCSTCHAKLPIEGKSSCEDCLNKQKKKYTEKKKEKEKKELEKESEHFYYDYYEEDGKLYYDIEPLMTDKEKSMDHPIRILISEIHEVIHKKKGIHFESDFCLIYEVIEEKRRKVARSRFKNKSEMYDKISDNLNKCIYAEIIDEYGYYNYSYFDIFWLQYKDIHIEEYLKIPEEFTKKYDPDGFYYKDNDGNILLKNEPELLYYENDPFLDGWCIMGKDDPVILEYIDNLNKIKEEELQKELEEMCIKRQLENERIIKLKETETINKSYLTMLFESIRNLEFEVIEIDNIITKLWDEHDEQRIIKFYDIKKINVYKEKEYIGCREDEKEVEVFDNKNRRCGGGTFETVEHYEEEIILKKDADGNKMKKHYNNYETKESKYKDNIKRLENRIKILKSHIFNYIKNYTIHNDKCISIESAIEVAKSLVKY